MCVCVLYESIEKSQSELAFLCHHLANDQSRVDVIAKFQMNASGTPGTPGTPGTLGTLGVKQLMAEQISLTCNMQRKSVPSCN